VVSILAGGVNLAVAEAEVPLDADASVLSKHPIKPSSSGPTLDTELVPGTPTHKRKPEEIQQSFLKWREQWREEELPAVTLLAFLWGLELELRTDPSRVAKVVHQMMLKVGYKAVIDDVRHHIHVRVAG
jgi:hypothetical protein